MPGRVYRVGFDNVAVTALQDLIAIVAGSGKLTELLRLELSQSTELGDAAEEMLRIAIKTGATVAGSGGGAMTAIPSELGSPAFAGSARINDTTPAGTGTIVTHKVINWNIRVPLDMIFVPEEIISIGANRLVIGLLANPADSVTMSGYATIRETG